MSKKFQVEVAISYKDMEGQSSLSHLHIRFKARILCQLANYASPSGFLVANNKSEIGIV